MARARRRAPGSSPYSEKTFELPRGERREELRRRRAVVSAIHAHVEGARRARAEAESALGPIELMRGDAEIEQNAVDSDPSLFASNLLEVTKRSLYETDAVAEGGESLASLADRVGIDVEADQDSVGCGAFEDRLCMAAATERAVDDHRAGLQVELFERFIEKDGYVVGSGRHAGRLPSIRPPGLPGMGFAG
jgi:hypothetical protein